MSNWLNCLLTLFLEATNPICTDLIWLLWTGYFNTHELSLTAMYWLSQLLCTNCFNFCDLSQTAMDGLSQLLCAKLFQLFWAESDCYVLFQLLWPESDCYLLTVSTSMTQVRLLRSDCFNFYDPSQTATYWLFQLLWAELDCCVLTVLTSVT